ncbi:hypothetical protein ACVQKW_16190, partial [Edwardsiella tarda]
MDNTVDKKTIVLSPFGLIIEDILNPKKTIEKQPEYFTPIFLSQFYKNIDTADKELEKATKNLTQNEKEVSQLTVYTKENLIYAQEIKTDEIIIIGKLAKQVHNTRVIANIKGKALFLLFAAIAAGPFTGGSSLTLAAASLAGTEIAVIITAISLGISLIMAISKDYEEIE